MFSTGKKNQKVLLSFTAKINIVLLKRIPQSRESPRGRRYSQQHKPNVFVSHGQHNVGSSTQTGYSIKDICESRGATYCVPEWLWSTGHHQIDLSFRTLYKDLDISPMITQSTAHKWYILDRIPYSEGIHRPPLVHRSSPF